MSCFGDPPKVIIDTDFNSVFGNFGLCLDWRGDEIDFEVLYLDARGVDTESTQITFSCWGFPICVFKFKGKETA